MRNLLSAIEPGMSRRVVSSRIARSRKQGVIKKLSVAGLCAGGSIVYSRRPCQANSKSCLARARISEGVVGRSFLVRG